MDQNNFAIVVRQGEHMWTPEGTHVIDPKTGMTVHAGSDTVVYFKDKSTFEWAGYRINMVRNGGPRGKSDLTFHEAPRGRLRSGPNNLEPIWLIASLMCRLLVAKKTLLRPEPRMVCRMAPRIWKPLHRRRRR